MTEEPHELDNSQFNQLLLLVGIFVLVMCMLSAYAWVQLPDDVLIPVHWGIDGQPDRFGGKAEGLLFLPVITLSIGIVFRLIPVIEPRRRNLLRSITAYRITLVTVCLFMLGLHFAIIGNLMGFFAPDVSSIVTLLISLLLIVIGNYLGKLRSNFLFGIRTPWTLTSELSWNKTHRIGGKLFVASGSTGLLGQFLLPDNALYLLIIVLIASVVFLFVYSYIIWRDDPNKARY